MKSFKEKIKKETNAILTRCIKNNNEILTVEKVKHLPVPVKRWLKVSRAIKKEKTQTVRLKQNFKMKLKPKQKKWHHAIAQQLFTTGNPAFIWTVRLKMAPLISVIGRDKFIDGKGEMQMKLNGIFNLGKETGKKMDEGTLQRYLGETAWFPSAALSPYILWEEFDARSAKATMNYKGTSGSGTFYFNNKGHFEKFVARRYMGNTPDAKRYEWVITAHEHAEFKGIIIPSKLEATWMLESGPWNWVILEITEVQYNISNKNIELL